MKKRFCSTVLAAVLVFLSVLISGCGAEGDGGRSKTGSGGGLEFILPDTSGSGSGRKEVVYTPKNFGEMKAVWISYIEMKTLLTGKSEEAFTASIREAFQNAKELGLNTVVVHVRPYGDALYQSALFPWSSYAKAFGQSPGFDPLAIMTEQAHKLGLSIHAWINPYRALTEEEAKIVSNDYPFSKWYHGAQKGKYIVNVSGRWYYNPGVEEVRQLIVAGIEEIIKYYPVDGIHFDDYFYPTTDPAFDAELYNAYRQEGGTLELDVWRRENVNALLRDCYLAVKRKNEGIQFGISPQANISNNYKTQYADVIRWCSAPGYLDYICPQIYYSFKSETTDFMQALAEWSAIVTQPSIRLYIGLAPYKVGADDKWACTGASGGECSAPKDCGKDGWKVSDPGKSDILSRQVGEIRANERCSGMIFYNFQSLFTPSENVKTQLESERKALKKILAEE